MRIAGTAVARLEVVGEPTCRGGRAFRSADEARDVSEIDAVSFPSVLGPELDEIAHLRPYPPENLWQNPGSRHQRLEELRALLRDERID
jgi:hypothetical protein